jgi:tetratricopeptide (TPR) repeat protein
MNHSTHDIDLIERYFDNELSSTEKSILEERLKNEDTFKKLFDQEKLLINTIRFNAAKDQLQFLKGVEAKLSQTKTSHLQQFRYYYAAAACVTLLFVVYFALPLFRETPTELYSSYFTLHPNVFEPTLRGEQIIDERKKAFQAYDAGDYQRASELFGKLLKENKEPGMLLLAGNAYLMIGNTAEAKRALTDLINNHDDLDLQAKWYLSLCYLREGNTEEARKLLKELGDTEISYANKAKELLKKVE